jgi:hypothetical protein
MSEARSSRIVVCFGLLTLLASAIVKAGPFHSALPLASQADTREADKQDQTDAVAEESLSQDPKERGARLAKDMRYNGGGCDITALKPDHFCFFDQSWPRGLPLIPLQESTIAFAGQVSKIQTYLSEDRTHVYTEITVRIEESFKSPPNSKLASGQTVVVDQIGGAIRMHSGQLVYDGTHIDFLGRTHAGGRYVLFAKNIHQGKDLTLIRGYELRDGRAFELTDSGSPSSVLVSTAPRAADTLSEEKTFLQAVRKAAGN